MSIDDTDRTAVDLFKEMLSFCGVELQSHAAVILGLALLIFAAVQAWSGLSDAQKSTSYHPAAFAFFVAVVGAGIAYQLWRLYIFGKLASALLYGSDSLWLATKKEWNEIRTTKLGEKWGQLFDLTKVRLYADRIAILSSSKLVRMKLLRVSHNSLRLNFWVLAVAFELSLGLSYGFIFGGFNLNFLELVSVSSVILLAWILSRTND